MYEAADGSLIRDVDTLARFRRMAVPPAYRDVRFAEDSSAHLQAVGQDDAGRLQYRYHPDWRRVRESLKAQRLASFALAMPAIARSVGQALARPEPDRRMALAAAVRLVALTAIRAGHDQYAQAHGTRGATTLLKSHVTIKGDEIALRFKGKGGKQVEKRTRSASLARALEKLKALPGRRLFKFVDEAGRVHAVRATTVNAFLKEITDQSVSLKDFRTLTASLGVLDKLSRLTPEASERGRRRQIKAAIEPLASELANTLTVCRSSYVHDAVITAFEEGRLGELVPARSRTARATLLSELLRNDGCTPPRSASPP